MKFPQEQWAEFAVGLTGTSAVIGKGICWYPEKQSLWVVAGNMLVPWRGGCFLFPSRGGFRENRRISSEWRRFCRKTSGTVGDGSPRSPLGGAGWAFFHSPAPFVRIGEKNTIVWKGRFLP